MDSQYNTRSPAVKRLMKEAQELSEATWEYHAAPLEDNLFEWHFTVRGPVDTDYQGGFYHGRIVLPAEYPMKPPNIIILTPNGRFEVGKKICLSISTHHPESWQPSWSIRTALLAIIGFMPTPGQGTIGSLDYTPEERKNYARKSANFKCEECPGGLNIPALLKSSNEDLVKATMENEMKEIMKNIELKDSEEKELSPERRAIKEASKITLQKFKEKLEARTAGLISGISDMKSPGPPGRPRQSSPNLLENRPRGPPVNNFLKSMTDWLVVLIVAGIAAIIYRRYGSQDEKI